MIEFMDNYFLFFFIFLVLLALWTFYDYSRFSRRNGNLKRGLMVWAESLSWEKCQMLESLPPTVDLDGGFMCKEGREILIAQNQPLIQFGGRRRSRFRYAGYINLSAPQNRLEFRTTVSTVVTYVFVLIFIILFFSGFFTGLSGEFFGLLISCFVPLIFITFFIASILQNHYRERQKIKSMLEQALAISDTKF